MIECYHIIPSSQLYVKRKCNFWSESWSWRYYDGRNRTKHWDSCRGWTSSSLLPVHQMGSSLSKLQLLPKVERSRSKSNHSAWDLVTFMQHLHLDPTPPWVSPLVQEEWIAEEERIPIWLFSANPMDKLELLMEIWLWIFLKIWVSFLTRYLLRLFRQIQTWAASSPARTSLNKSFLTKKITSSIVG